MMFGLRVLSFLFVFLTSAECFAADATQTDALNAITDTAAKICNTVPTSGERDSAEVKGDVKAEVSGLLKKLGDLGISGTGRYTHDDYVGVVQEQLAAALKHNSDCRLTVFMALQGKLMPQSSAPAAPSGWSMSPEQAESLRVRLASIFPKPAVFIQCRTMAADCERLAYILFDVLQRAAWPVSQPMTTRGGNVIITGERGIKVISRSDSARELKDLLQAGDVGGLPAELVAAGDNDHIRINIGDRP